MPDSELFWLVLIALVSGGLLAAVGYGVVLLARIARGLDGLQGQVDDLRTRLGVLDPGETRVAQSASTDADETSSGAARSPDETLPGS